METKKQLTFNEVMFERFKGEGSDLTLQQINGYINELQALGVAKDLNHSQFYSFIKICNTLKLNPLLKQVYAYPAQGGQIVTVISYMQYLKAAEKHPKYQLPTLELVEYGPDNKKLPLEEIYIIAKVKRLGEETVLEKKFIMSEWNKGTAVWKKQPIHMLWVRAMKNILATAYPDAICDYEQLEFQSDVEGVATTPTRRVSKPVPPPVKELNTQEIGGIFAQGEDNDNEN